MPEEISQLKDLLEYANYITWPVAGILMIYFLRPMWLALASWIQKNPESQIKKDFYAFKEMAEENHYHDIENLKQGQKDIWKTITNLEVRVNKIAEDIAFIRGKLNGQ